MNGPVLLLEVINRGAAHKHGYGDLKGRQNGDRLLTFYTGFLYPREKSSLTLFSAFSPKDSSLSARNEI
jgi:hypothetical protein